MLSKTFQWKSRRAACDDLLSFLQNAPPTPRHETPRAREAAEREHRAAARLLEVLGETSDSPALHSLVLDPSRPPWVRVHALRALVAVGGSLSPSEHADLRQDERRSDRAALPAPIGLGEPRLTARSAQANRDRDLVTSRANAFDEIERLGEALEVSVDEAPRPLADRAALRRWAEGIGTTRAERRSLEARAHLAMNQVLGGPVALLREVIERESLCSFFWCKLEAGLWQQDPDYARAWLSRLLVTAHEETPTRRGAQALAHLVHTPKPSDAELLTAAAAHGHPDLRYLGVHGLDRLGALDDTELERAVVDSNALVTLRAHALRAARGSLSSCQALVAHARDHTKPVRVRAEAVDQLALLAPARHFETLEQALLTDHGSDDGHTLPVAEAAAFGIARVGSDRALTALVRAALTAPANSLADLIETNLLAMVRGEGVAGCVSRKLDEHHPLRTLRVLP